MVRFSLSILVVAAVLAFAQEARAEAVWCQIHGKFFPAPHDGIHEDSKFCPRCSGVFPRDHVHLADAEKAAEAAKKEADAAANKQEGADAGPEGASSKETTPQTPESTFAAVWSVAKKYWWALPLLLAFWLFGVPLLRAFAARSRSAGGEDFPIVDGEPQGVVLVPGRLVCSENGMDDGGGTAIGYPAMILSGRRWSRAFVKRMIGKGMRQDDRFPALRFEADVLRALEDTGVVPRLLSEPVQTTLRGRSDPNGPVWAYYAMSIAPGRPWPPRGGLGADTHRALVKLCEALVRLHQHGIGHHDLKPQNLFWDAPRRSVTLIDLGSAIDHREGAPDRLVNPIGGTKITSKPWIPPERDGDCLAHLSLASDAWVFGLILCEAIVGGVHDPDRTKRRWPENPADREWFFERLKESESADMARMVVDGLFALEASRRPPLSKVLEFLRKEWDL